MNTDEEILLNEIIKRLDDLTVTNSVFLLSPAASLTSDQYDALNNTPTTPNSLNPYATLADVGGGGGGGIASIVAGSNIDVDNTNPSNPVVGIVSAPTFSGVVTFGDHVVMNSFLIIAGHINGRDIAADGNLIDSSVQPNTTIQGALVLKSTITNISATYTLNWATCNNFDLTLTASTVITFSNDVDNETLVVVVKQNATGGFTLTLPASINWSEGTVPTYTTTANSKDVFTFIKINGIIYGSVITNFS